MEFSVIIPVYNAERFLTKAVESALQQEETGEVLLIEDGSPDNSLKICRELERRHEKVKLFRHPDGQNRGAGATRNLGIRKASCELIGFLDADDFYLPGRFRVANSIFERDSSVDAVYEAIGMHFYDQASKEKWLSNGGEEITRVDRRTNPKLLFEAWVGGEKTGYIHLDGLVVKKKLFEISGYFPEHLKLHQDTAVILQLAAFGNFVPGKLDEPVALRGIHADNRITQNKKEEETKALLWQTLFSWALKKNLNLNRLVLIYNRHIQASYRMAKKDPARRFNGLDNLNFLFRNLRKHPVLFVCAAPKFLRRNHST